MRKHNFEGMPLLFWPLSKSIAKTNQIYDRATLQLHMQIAMINQESGAGESELSDSIAFWKAHF